MMSVFHISNTNGGIRDPVVHLEQKSRVMETWEGNEWICLYNISRQAPYWLLAYTGRLQTSGNRTNKHFRRK